eukprot:GFKZ01013796.1.p1 GENE.GFKZ01013796.1~~GFKZ01013796.1.p1  ORF type:complete len:364 (+),score=23.78 GFKZ01013796.1:101-1192(+)
METNFRLLFIAPFVIIRGDIGKRFSPRYNAPSTSPRLTKQTYRFPTCIINNRKKPTQPAPVSASSRSSKRRFTQPSIRYPPGKFPLAAELDFVLNHPLTEAIIAFLVSLNCLAFALQTLNVTPIVLQAFRSYESNLTVVFLLEFFARWYGKGLSPRYLLTRNMILDFIAVAPLGFAVTDQSEALFVRILRLSRILRIQGLVMDSESGKEMMENMTAVQIRLANVGLSLFSLLYVSAGLFYQAEKGVNPAVQNFFDAFYFSTITLFTVGYGDVTPLTGYGRSITVLTVLTGAVLVPFQLSEVERVRKLSSRNREDPPLDRAPSGARFSDALFPPYDAGIEVRDDRTRPPRQRTTGDSGPLANDP